MQGRINLPVHGGGGGELELNVFAQATEPETKEGIWINTSATGDLPAINKFEYEGVEIISNLDIYINKKFTQYFKFKDLPYSFEQGAAISIGEDIYFFGGNNYNKYARKYNVRNGTYTKLTTIPTGFAGGSAAAVGTDIYLFGCESSSSMYAVYKYNTNTNSYLSRRNLPYLFNNGPGLGCGSAAAVGSNIYLFGSGNSNNYKYVYRYDTDTNTYTRLSNLPYDFRSGSAAAIGTDIYLFGSYATSNCNEAYKYDTLTDTCTKLTNVPYKFSCGSVAAIGTDIYLFGSINNRTKAYKYDTLTDIYTVLTDLPYDFYYGSAVATDFGIYLLGSASYKENNYKMLNFHVKNNHIYLFNGIDIFETKIINKIYISIFYAAICQNDSLLKYPAYYGDGTQWIQLPE